MTNIATTTKDQCQYSFFQWNWKEHDRVVSPVFEEQKNMNKMLTVSTIKSWRQYEVSLTLVKSELLSHWEFVVDACKNWFFLHGRLDININKRQLSQANKLYLLSYQGKQATTATTMQIEAAKKKKSEVKKWKKKRTKKCKNCLFCELDIHPQHSVLARWTTIEHCICSRKFCL